MSIVPLCVALTQAEFSVFLHVPLKLLEGEQRLAVATELVDSLEQRVVIDLHQLGQTLSQLAVRAAENEIRQIDRDRSTADHLPIQEVDVVLFGRTL